MARNTRQFIDCLDKPTFRDRARDARLGAARNLRQWTGVEDGDYEVLSELIGCPNGKIMSSMTEEQVRLCELLAGPHGYAIYKALMARKQEVPRAG